MILNPRNTLITAVLPLFILLPGFGAAQEPAALFAEPAAAIEAGEQAIADQDYSKAVNILEQAVLIHSQEPELLRQLGIAYHMAGRNEQALAILEKALPRDGENSELHYTLGVIYLARARELSVLKVRRPLKASIEHLEQAIVLDNQHVAAHYYLIQLLLNTPRPMGGDTERARALKEKLQALSPLHGKLAQSSIAADSDDMARAEEILQESLAAGEQSALANYTALEFYNSRGQHEKAISYGNAFLRLPKRWDEAPLASAHFLLAQSHQHTGNRDRSLAHYAEVLRLTENPRLIKDVQKAVREMAEAESSKNAAEN